MIYDLSINPSLDSLTTNCRKSGNPGQRNLYSFFLQTPQTMIILGTEPTFKKKERKLLCFD